MIARDEAKVLPAMADACRGLIDSYCIVVDPRTTDDPVDVARKVFDYVPGAVHISHLTAEEFTFASARNEMLALARESDYHLMLLDADSPPSGTLPDELTEPAYICDTNDVNDKTSWTSPLLLRSDVDAHYRMPAHEYIEMGDTPVVHLKDIHVVRSSVGAGKARMEWTVDVLRREVDGGGTDAPRACLYLANTLHALGRVDEAVSAYMMRMTLEGHPEEKFFAAYRVGCLLQENDAMRAVRAYLDAYGLRPTRAEPLYRIAVIANMLGNHQMALALATQGASIPPTDDTQFVERWIEKWGLYHQWAVAVRALGDKDAAVNVARQLLARNDVNDDIRHELEQWL